MGTTKAMPRSRSRSRRDQQAARSSLQKKKNSRKELTWVKCEKIRVIEREREKKIRTKSTHYTKILIWVRKVGVGVRSKRRCSKRKFLTLHLFLLPLPLSLSLCSLINGKNNAHVLHCIVPRLQLQFMNFLRTFVKHISEWVSGRGRVEDRVRERELPVKAERLSNCSYANELCVPIKGDCSSARKGLWAK